MMPTRVHVSIALLAFVAGLFICQYFFCEYFLHTFSRDGLSVLEKARKKNPSNLVRFENIVSTAGPKLKPDFRRITLNISVDETTIVESAEVTGPGRGGFRVQILNQSIFIVDEIPGFQTRHKSMKMLLFLLVSAKRLRDNDFFFSSSDRPNDLKGIFFYCCSIRDLDCLSLPDWSFVSFPEVHTLAYPALMKSLLDKGNEIPYDRKIDRLFFRGANTNPSRGRFADIHHDLLDIAIMNWKLPNENEDKLNSKGLLVGDGNYASLADTCEHRLLMHFEGNGYSLRLKYLLACNSTVFICEEDVALKVRIDITFIHFLFYFNVVLIYEMCSQEWWQKYLVPMVHYIPVKPDGSDVIERVEWALDNPELAQQIAAAGANFVATFLTQENVLRYSAGILNAYSRALTFQPHLHERAIELTRSLYFY